MRLSDQNWRTKYTPEDGDLLKTFYVPALRCAVRYDRSAGYFSAGALGAAAQGLEGLIENKGKMRLIVGCTLGEPEIMAIERGESLKDTIAAKLLSTPLNDFDDQDLDDALELLAWMVANGYLEVKVAIPCDKQKRPLKTDALFHEKAGIIEDRQGERLAFNGSINETVQGWKHNWDSFHVFTTWGGSSSHVEAEEKTFKLLWADKSKGNLVIDVPSAVRQKLLDFMPPKDELPKRLQKSPALRKIQKEQPEKKIPPTPEFDPRSIVWTFIHQAPAMPNGGERVGEATSAVDAWPHQVKAFERMYTNWPPKLLIADEVGLGKTIQAGMLLRQSWLAGKAKRILILAPKGILNQWQIELREKFNLNWPIYDGQKLTWYPSPALRDHAIKPVAPDSWHQEPFVLASSQLMRRRDRASELLEKAEPWDLIVLDEAHHARRKGGGIGGADDRPNLLLRLMRELRHKTQGLILLTATPMQVSPIEVWDLLDLLGMPDGWSEETFMRYFEYASHPMPGHPEMAFMASMFRSIESLYGLTPIEEAQRFVPGGSKIKAKSILSALREPGLIPIKQLETPERKAAVELLKANTPVRKLMSRHTRELLRRYFKDGKLGIRIADREVEDRFVLMSFAERGVYEEVEDYISGTFNQASPEKRTAVGFVMTVYRRRLASSFHALIKTLESRLKGLKHPVAWGGQSMILEEDVLEDDLAPEMMDADEVADLEAQALMLEEQVDIGSLLAKARKLPTDTKAKVLVDVIRETLEHGYKQVMVFTQYTDTMDFLRDELSRNLNLSVICFSGRGGEKQNLSGKWETISRERSKQLFMAGDAQIMVCTDAAAEGLNFQFCGALINYDMPWNPMKVEQRIGRIDRLGQEYQRIRVINLHYEGTVEADIYRALRERINLFQAFIGRLQPILAKLPGAISHAALAPAQERGKIRDSLLSSLEEQAKAIESHGFDIDEMVGKDWVESSRPEALLDLKILRKILTKSSLLPPGTEVKKIGKRDYAYQQPGMLAPIRVTTDAIYFDLHPESIELWSPGNPVFPNYELLSEKSVSKEDFERTVSEG